MCLTRGIRPAIGGGLAKPYERFPEHFKNNFWKEYPYFLSSLGPAVIIFISFLIALFFFQEVSRLPLALLVKGSYSQTQTLPKRRIPFYPAPSSAITPPEDHSEPASFRKLLTYPVVLSASNYVALAFMDGMLSSLLPLFMAMPIELGGLGFSPMAIGYILGTLGIGRALFSMLLFARLLRRFGERCVFIAGMLTFNINFITLPLINIVGRRTGVTSVVWCLFTFSLFLAAVTDLCYSKSEPKGKRSCTH